MKKFLKTVMWLFCALPLLQVCAQERIDTTSRTFKKTKEWEDVTVKLLNVRQTKTADRVVVVAVESKVKMGDYVITPKPRYEQEQFNVLMIADPNSGKRFFIRGDRSFYICDSSGLKGYLVFNGILYISEVLLELPKASGDEADIKKFEETVKVQTLFENRRIEMIVNRWVFDDAIPHFYFSDGPAPGGMTVEIKLDKISMDGDVLVMNMHNPYTKFPATVSINLKERKVVRSVVNNVEMDLDKDGKIKSLEQRQLFWPLPEFKRQKN